MRFHCNVCAYFYEGESAPEQCPVCGTTNSFVDEDMDVLQQLYCSQQLIDAMQKLRGSDIIEYELKMSQFRNQYEQQRAAQQVQNQTQQSAQLDNRPKCPTCGSTNIEKISVGKKIGGSFLFGIFSSDVRNTMHCKDCGAKW